MSVIDSKISGYILEDSTMIENVTADNHDVSSGSLKDGFCDVCQIAGNNCSWAVMDFLGFADFLSELLYNVVSTTIISENFSIFMFSVTSSNVEV